MQIYPPLDALGDSAFQKFRFSLKIIVFGGKNHESK